MATWSPTTSRLCSEYLLRANAGLLRANAGLLPGAHVLARQVVKIQLFMGGKSEA